MNKQTLQYEFAPLEGVTDAVFRRTHRRYYPGLARYYAPFISPTQNHILTPHDRRELSFENNPGVPLVPQLLGKKADDLLWAMRTLADMGYDEVNLNLGCPSGTVTAKGKGAGMLADPDQLDRLLEAVFSAAPVRVSLKTRLGMKDPAEFLVILRIFDRYPVCRLIIHPRTAAQMYSGTVHWDAVEWARENTSIPLCLNGDLFTTADITRLLGRFPGTQTVMLGRGLVANPGMLAGGGKETLISFHDALCAEYPAVFGNENSAMHRMKALWVYIVERYPDSVTWKKRIIKTKRWLDFLALTRDILRLDPAED